MNGPVCKFLPEYNAAKIWRERRATELIERVQHDVNAFVEVSGRLSPIGNQALEVGLG